MKRVVKERKVPRLSSIDHHALSDHEVLALVKQMLAAR